MVGLAVTIVTMLVTLASLVIDQASRHQWAETIQVYMAVWCLVFGMSRLGK